MSGKLVLHGITITDVRDAFPDKLNQSVSWSHAMFGLIGIAIHHDGVDFGAGDHNYNGQTLDEDVARLNAIYNYNYDRLGGFPYPLVASPNGRLFLCRDLETWGAHVAKRNNELGGIAIMGNYSYTMPPVEALCAASLGCILYWRAIGGLREVKGHGDWAYPDSETECPGPLRDFWIPKVLKFAAVNAQRYPA